jgi:hypothetical protein
MKPQKDKERVTPEGDESQLSKGPKRVNTLIKKLRENFTPEQMQSGDIQPEVIKKIASQVHTELFNENDLYLNMVDETT